MNKMVRDQESMKMVRDEEMTKRESETIQKFIEIVQRHKKRNNDYLRDNEGIIIAISEYIKSGKFKDLELKPKYDEVIQWKLRNNMML